MSEPQRNLTEDALEVAEGREREKLEGSVPEMATEAELREALEKAFDYRGDVTVTRKDGSRVEGYIFDRRSGPTLAESFVRIIPREAAQAPRVSPAEGQTLRQTQGRPWGTESNSTENSRPTSLPSSTQNSQQTSRQKISIPYSDIAALVFSGRDMAAGKSWEAWVRKYWEKKAAGEKNIALEPEKLE